MGVRVAQIDTASNATAKEVSIRTRAFLLGTTWWSSLMTKQIAAMRQLKSLNVWSTTTKRKLSESTRVHTKTNNLVVTTVAIGFGLCSFMTRCLSSKESRRVKQTR